MRPARSVLVAASIALLASTGCLERHQGSGQKVTVIGDSITSDAQVQVRSALSGTSRSVNGSDGIDLAAARAQLIQPAAQTGSKIVVIELGINSAREIWNSADLPHLENALHDLDAVPCVIWVTPTALEPSYYDHLGNGTIHSRIQQFKASLVKRLPKHPNQRLADWGAAERLQPSWYAADHLHNSSAGMAAYAKYVKAQVDQGC
jgi:hypothetical protein